MDLMYDEVVVEKEHAKLIDFDGMRMWIPKSVIVGMDKESIEIQEWFVKENDLEEYVV